MARRLAGRTRRAEQRKLLNQYSTWALLRRLRTAAAAGPVGHYRDHNARDHLRVAATFLDRLHDRSQTLADGQQADLDRYFASASTSARKALRRS